MGNGIGLQVAAGLVAGVALIVLFSTFTKPAFTMSDDEIRQKVRSLPEVQAFNERYGALEIVWREGTTTYVEYQIGRTWYPASSSSQAEDDSIWVPDSITKQLRLTIKVNPFGKTNMYLECLGRISGSEPTTIEYIRTTRCLESP